MKKIYRIILVIAGIAVVLVAIAMMLAPGYIIRYIEENDKELIGREVIIDDLSIGWFSGRLGIEGIDMLEANDHDHFLRIDAIETRISLWKLLGNHVHIPYFTLSGLDFSVIQNGSQFNFDDLAASDEDADTTASESSNWKFTLENLEVTGKINYSSDIAPQILADSLEVTIPLITGDMQQLDIAASLVLGSGGKLKTTTHLDLLQSTYDLNFEGQKIGIALAEPYFAQAIRLSKVGGDITTLLQIHGSWADSEIFNLSGNIDVNGFHMTDPMGENLASCRQFTTVIDSIRMKDAYYRIDRIELNGLYGIYEMYDEGDNFSRLMVADSTASVAEGDEEALDYSNPFLILAHYISELAKSYSESVYRIGHFEVKDSEFQFNDYTPTDPFRYRFTKLGLVADSLSSSRERINVHMSSVLNNAGIFEGSVSAFTANPADMDIKYEIRGTGLTPFAPYTSHYVSYPITRGELMYACNTSIRDGKIVSSNNMVIKDFTFGSKSESMSFYNLPVKLAVSLLKDLNGEIHLDIPIEGDLKDPNYKLGKVIWNTVKNILIKAVTAPYRILARTFKVDEDRLKLLHFNLLERDLSKEHRGQLNDLSKVLSQKPELNAEFKRITTKYEEMERYCITQSKRRHLFGENVGDDLDKDQRTQLRDYDIKDTLFIQWLDARIDPTFHNLPVQRKCVLYIGEKAALEAVDQIGFRRTRAIYEYMVNDEKVDSARIRFFTLPDDSLISSRSTAIYNIGFWMAD